MASVSFQTQIDNALHIHHDHHTKLGQRVHRLLHPDGKTTHVAASPEDAYNLKRTLSVEERVNVVIAGSPEHTDTLRLIRTHCETRRDELRRLHGQLYEEFESLREQMDDISSQLAAVTEEETALDANFSKYGYSAAIRTHDHRTPPKTPSASSASSISSISLADAHQARSKQGVAMKMFATPVVRQYHHKGLIWRAPECEEIISYELFVDLIYVGYIAISGDATAEELTGSALLRFVITTLMGWKIWNDIIQCVSWFEADDIFRRLHVLVILVALVGLTTNIYYFSEQTYTPAVAFFVTTRVATGILFGIYSWLLPAIRPFMIFWLTMLIIPVALWIGSIHVESPQRQALIWLALVIDIWGNGFMWTVKRLTSMSSREWIKTIFDFVPALNIEHRVERTNAFVSLVFGYSVVALLYQSAVSNPIDGYFGKAALGLIQAFIFSGLYFEIDSFNLHTHAIRRHLIACHMWFDFHITLILGYVIASAALARIVLIHDVDSVDMLAEMSAVRSESELSSTLRWYYCGGLGIALLSINGISATHSYRVIAHEGSISRWMTKPKRIFWRSMAGIVIICLGKVESLNSLQLIATTSALSCYCIALELWANTMLCEGKKFSAAPRQCKYVARCQMRKKELEDGVKDGTITTVTEVNGEKGQTFIT